MSQDKYKLYDDARNYIDMAISAKNANDFKNYLEYLKKATISLYEYAKLEYDPQKRKDTIERADKFFNIIKSFETNKPKVEVEVNKKVDTKEEDSDDLELVPSESKTTFDDIIGLDYAKSIIKDEITDRYIEKYQDLYRGKDYIKGILLFGVPGTGKTLFARAVAGEIKAPFYSKSAKDLLNKYVGESEKNISKLFDEMRNKNKLSVLLLDDSDELFAKRSDSSQGHEVSLINAFLHEMDGFEQHNNKVLVIATTNRPQSFDAAILRRFTLKIKIDLPNSDLRKEMLDKYSDKVFDESFLNELSEKTYNFSGADIKNLCDDAKRIALRRNKALIDDGVEVKENVIIKEDIIKALLHRSAEVRQEDLDAIEEFDRGYGSGSKNNKIDSEDKSNLIEPKNDKCIKEYVYPTISLLNDCELGSQEGLEEYIKTCSDKIVELLDEFNLEVEVANSIIGASFIRLDLKLGKGISISNVTRYLNDIEMRLQCNIRISNETYSEYLGIEIPNPMRRIVCLKEVIPDRQDDLFQIGLGKKVNDEVFYLSNRDFTHILIGGTTNAGKSSLIHSIICQLIMNYSPSQLNFIMIDTKRVELTYYNELPHLAREIIKTKESALIALKELVKEQTRRYNLIEATKCRNIEEYNDCHENKKLPYIILIIDELAELSANDDFLNLLSLLAAQGRAAGIKIIAATQRPSAKIIRGDVKANFSTKIALMVSTIVDSKIILDHGDAEKLIGKGDMLVAINNDIVRLQSPFVTTEEIKRITNFIAENN